MDKRTLVKTFEEVPERRARIRNLKNKIFAPGAPSSFSDIKNPLAA